MATIAAINSASEQFRVKAAEVKEDLKEMGALAPDMAREKYNELRQGASEYYEKGKERVVEAKDGVEDFIRDRPMQSVLIAAGAGLLLGYLLTRPR